MSGHSHFATIKHKKGAADSKRSQVFSRLAKELTIAAREGADPTANPRLRSVIEKAREENMPSDNIDRAIKKGTGEDAGQLEEVLFEAYGPGNIALLIAAITDNKNRILGEIKQVLAKNKGKFVEGGAVRWLFERRGVITLQPKEEGVPLSPRDEIELIAIEAGAEDLYWHDDILDMYINPSEFEKATQTLQERGFTATSSLDWVPKERINVSEQDMKATEKLFETLDENDDVQDIYSNI